MEREIRQMRSCASEFKTRENGEDLVIEGYFSVFNSEHTLREL